jgi:hypothetical protein
MRRLLIGALLLAFALAPSLARAETAGAPAAAPTPMAEAAGGSTVDFAPAQTAAAGGTDYAAREAAAPELGKFEGGSVTFIIGGGAVFVVLVIVLIVLLI